MNSEQPGNLTPNLNRYALPVDQSLHDIQSALLAEQALNSDLQDELNEQRLFTNRLMDSLPIGLIIVDHKSLMVEYANPKCKEIFGWSLALPQNIDELCCQLFQDHHLRQITQEKVYSQVEFPETICLKNLPMQIATGEEKSVSITTIPILGQHKTVTAVLDDTERKRTEDLFKYLAAYDSLTDLPNRTLFHDRLNHTLEHARRNNSLSAVMILDLDNFKNINNAYGLDYGDKLLSQVAKRLKNVLRESDTVARLGGDEYGILIETISNPDDLDLVIKKIQSAFVEPFFINANYAYVSASIGISLYPEHGSTMQTLIKNADTAMHEAKEAGKNTFSLFRQVMGDRALDTMMMANELRHALSKNEFVLHYQPQYDITTGKVIGIEALLRWNHPVQGLIYPSKFIPLAEETGAIVSIGEWVLRTACKQSIIWQKSNIPPLRMAVNLSEQQIKHPGFIGMVQQVLSETKLNPDLLVLEFTENIIFRDTDNTYRILEQLRSLGVHLALDDFGTGYTSLSYLARFPFDTIKIDLSFAKKITTYPGDAAIVAGVIAIAKSLDMATIVEGVETSEQAKFFVEKGCSQIQGWYFSPALSVGDMEKVLEGK